MNWTIVLAGMAISQRPQKMAEWGKGDIHIFAFSIISFFSLQRHASTLNFMNFELQLFSLANYSIYRSKHDFRKLEATSLN